MFELRLWGGFAKQRRQCLAQTEFPAGKLSTELQTQVDAAIQISQPHAEGNRSVGWWWILLRVKSMFGRSTLFSLGGSLCSSLFFAQKEFWQGPNQVRHLSCFV